MLHHHNCILTCTSTLSSDVPGKITILGELNNGTLHQFCGYIRAAECDKKKTHISASSTLNWGPQITKRSWGTDDISQVCLFSHSHFLDVYLRLSNLSLQMFTIHSHSYSFSTDDVFTEEVEKIQKLPASSSHKGLFPALVSIPSSSNGWTVPASKTSPMHTHAHLHKILLIIWLVFLKHLSLTQINSTWHCRGSKHIFECFILKVLPTSRAETMPLHWDITSVFSSIKNVAGGQ